MPARAEFETKLKCARSLANGMSIRQAAKSAGIAASTLSRWALANDEEFIEAKNAVEQYDSLNPTEPEFPDVFAGARGTALGVGGRDMNTLIRTAAGRA